MTGAAAVAIASRPDPLDVFIARCAARAKLYAAGELELQEAVDELQFRGRARRPRREARAGSRSADHSRRLPAGARGARRFRCRARRRRSSPDFDEYEGLTGASARHASRPIARSRSASATRRKRHRRRRARQHRRSPPPNISSCKATASGCAIGSREHSAEERAAIREHMEARRWPSRSEK